jgi:hypothetical protein
MLLLFGLRSEQSFELFKLAVTTDPGSFHHLQNKLLSAHTSCNVITNKNGVCILNRIEIRFYWAEKECMMKECKTVKLKYESVTNVKEFTKKKKKCPCTKFTSQLIPFFSRIIYQMGTISAVTRTIGHFFTFFGSKVHVKTRVVYKMNLNSRR